MHLRSLHALTDLLFSIFCLSVSYNYRIFNIELRILFVRITCSLYIYTLHILRITTSLYRVSIYLYVFSSRYIERVYFTPFYVCFSRFHFWINNDSRFESGCLFCSGSCVVGILRNQPIKEPPVRRSNKNRTIGSPFSSDKRMLLPSLFSLRFDLYHRAPIRPTTEKPIGNPISWRTVRTTRAISRPLLITCIFCEEFCDFCVGECAGVCYRWNIRANRKRDGNNFLPFFETNKSKTTSFVSPFAWKEIYPFHVQRYRFFIELTFFAGDFLELQKEKKKKKKRKFSSKTYSTFTDSRILIYSMYVNFFRRDESRLFSRL